jgi:hypothetical protein
MPSRVTFENSPNLAIGDTHRLPHLIITTVYHTGAGLVGFDAERDEAAAARAAAAAAEAEDGEDDGGSSQSSDDDKEEDDEAVAMEQEEEQRGGEDRRQDGSGSDGSDGASPPSSSSSLPPADAATAADPDGEAALMAAMGLPVSFAGGHDGGGTKQEEDDGSSQGNEKSGGGTKTKEQQQKKKKRGGARLPLHVRHQRAAAAVTAAAAAAANGGVEAEGLSRQLREELQAEPRAQELLRGLGLWEQEGEEEGRGGGSAQARRPHLRPRVKYWLQRYSLFSRYDAGVRLDAEGWYSVTPECVALWQARRALDMVVVGGATTPAGLVAVDAFAGCGGNTIALRRALDDPLLGTSPRLVDERGGCGGGGSQEEEEEAAPNGSSDGNARPPPRVLAFEIDRARLRMAKHNAQLYGFDPSSKASSIEWRRGDFFRRAAASAQCPVVFFSPPWGGPEYRRRGAVFGARTAFPAIGVTLAELLDVGRRIVQRWTASADQEEEQQQGGGGGGRGREKEEEGGGKRRQGVVVAFLPRNTDVGEIGRLAEERRESGAWGKVEEEWQLERNVMNGHLKGITLYCPCGVEEKA